MSTVVTTALAECEAVIERGLATFVEVGEALRRIRDERLYRESHGTFEDYCRERWEMSRKRAYDLMAAEEVRALLSPIGDTPTNEAQARELAPLRDKPERMAEAWAEAQDTARENGRPVTAADVRAVVQPKPREAKAQTTLVAGIVEKARHINELAPHLDLDVLQAISDEEKAEWKQQLYSARTVLSRLIAAL